MKKHLTDAFIKRVRPPKEGYDEYFDLGYSGLALCVGHGGVKSFKHYYRAPKLKHDTIGRWPGVSLAGARESWRQTRERLARGEAPLRSKSSLLFGTAIDEWFKRDMGPRNKQSSLKQISRIIGRDLLPAWGERAVDTITDVDVAELLDGIRDRGAGVKANRVHAALHRFFKWAAGPGRKYIRENPMTGLQRTKEVSRDHVVNDADLAKIWIGADKVPMHGDMVKLLILTGARREEIGALRWSEIKGDYIELANGRTKTGNGHIIPLSTQAKEILASVKRKAGSEFVFTLGGSKPVTGWSRAKVSIDEAAGVTGWRLHDLRRTVATGMQKLGVGLQVVEAVLGHTSGSRAGIIGVYQRHAYADEKRRALEAWGQHVAGLI